MSKLNYKYFLLIVLPMFILGSLGIYVLIATSAYAYLFLTLFFWITLSGLGIAVGFHRIFSHQCYQLKPWLDKIILFCGTLACQSSSLTWVSVHVGYHHPFADKEKDLHTPKKGFWNAFLGWTFKVSQTTVNHKYAVKLFRKPWHVFCHTYYFKIVWGFAIVFLLLFGWKAFLIGYCLAAMISILQDNLVNVLGHCPPLGYRNYDLDDISSNFIPLGYLGWGQGWHNNHHKYPARYNFGERWWEFDPCVIFIPLLKFGSECTKS